MGIFDRFKSKKKQEKQKEKQESLDKKSTESSVSDSISDVDSAIVPANDFDTTAEIAPIKVEEALQDSAELQSEEEVNQPTAEQQDKPKKKKRSLFSKFKQGLSKTSKILKTDIRDLFKKEGQLLDEAFLDKMREILFKSDMGYDATEEVLSDVATNFRGRVVQLDEMIATWSVKLKALMAQDESPIRFAESGPTIILVCGVNGSGKTTSIAKLAYLLKNSGKSVVLGAGDTFRAAAVKQLTVWAERIGADIVTGEDKSHPASVAYRAVEFAIANQTDICIIDTAGRLQTQTNLMTELTKIQTSIRKQLPEAPHEVLLVMDATTGQNGISQANKFTEAVDCSGIILAKLDGTAKGGVVVAIRQQVGLPVKYVGVGEQMEDLALFEPNKFVDAMFEDLLDDDLLDDDLLDDDLLDDD